MNNLSLHGLKFVFGMPAEVKEIRNLPYPQHRFLFSPTEFARVAIRHKGHGMAVFHMLDHGDHYTIWTSGELVGNFRLHGSLTARVRAGQVVERGVLAQRRKDAEGEKKGGSEDGGQRSIVICKHSTTGKSWLAYQTPGSQAPIETHPDIDRITARYGSHKTINTGGMKS